MDADWDLHAVVRGCCSAVSSSTTTTTGTGTASSQSPEFYSQQKSTCCSFFSDLFQPTSENSLEQFMNDLYNYNHLHYRNLEKPPSPPQSFTISPFNHHQQQQQQPEKQFQVKKQSLGISRCTTSHAHGTTTKIKKRKHLIKRVCQVPAEGSSPDFWSWRKYGQKPIKGSPYPRGYYRCSTLKGCSARKQVERNRSDPGMLIITYTGEHTHPLPTHINSLAGITRNKTTGAGDKPAPSSPETNTNKTQDTDYTDDENNFDISGVITDEDTFDGLDDLVATPFTGDVFSDHRRCQISWPTQPPPLPAGVDF